VNTVVPNTSKNSEKGSDINSFLKWTSTDNLNLEFLTILMSGVKIVVKENKYYVLRFSLHTAKVYLILPVKI
jgi:hypothetical protein